MAAAPKDPQVAVLASMAGTAVRRGCRATLLAVLAALALDASAGSITETATGAVLGANDLVAWGTALDDGTFVGTSYSRTSTGGLGVTASAASDLAVFNNGGGGGFTANFASGDILLDTFFADGPISIVFLSPVRGVGFNIVHEVTGSFAGTLDFYGAGNVLFGSVSVNGMTTLSADGSAAFLGGTSSLLDIVRVDVSVDLQGGSQALAINQMSLLTTPPVPEPSALALMLLGLATGGCCVRRRRATSLA